MLIHKLPQTPYTYTLAGSRLHTHTHNVICAPRRNSNAPLIEVPWSQLCLVGKPNTTSPIWNHFHSCHPSAFVQVSSSSHDPKRLAGQVCVGEAFSKLAKYKRDSGKWKMPTRNVATYAAIPISQRARADEELMRPLAWWRNSEPCLNRMPRRNTTG